MTGLYTMAMQLGSAAAAGGTTPLADAGGSWRAGLGVWALPAVLALVPWIIALRGHSRDGRVSTATRAKTTAKVSLAHNPRAWSLAVFFGLQSLSAYVVMGWLPEIYRSAGVDPSTAGILLSVVMALAAPIALLLPALANRLPDQRPLVVAVTVAMAAGWVGLAVAPRSGAWCWAVLLGIGSGAFPLALTLIGLRARTAATTTSLSAFAQSAGYVLAVAGPLTVGALHQFTGGWNAPLVLLLVLLGPQLIAGLIAGQGRAIDDLPGPRQLVGKALRPVSATESGTTGSRRSAARR
jgi:CP family cyanate transporter-like MFS transporter